MSNGKEFGYDGEAPNPPWIMRDVQNKCQRCGAIFVSPSRALCSRCLAVQDDHDYDEQR